jgi:hypothetical protein
MDAACKTHGHFLKASQDAAKMHQAVNAKTAALQLHAAITCPCSPHGKD